MKNMFNDPDYEKKKEILKNAGFEYAGDRYIKGSDWLSCKTISKMPLELLLDICHSVQ